MAAKKPAKKNVSNTQTKAPELPGKPVKYLAPKGADAFVCPVCKRNLLRGIVYDFKSTLYCSRKCIPKEG